MEEISQSNDFTNFTNFIFSKINSPYEEIEYIIKNNDTLEKIFKEFQIREEDIKKISVQLKQKKLTYIYPGRKLNLIIKKFKNNSNKIINLVYPISNTSSIEIRQLGESFIVKENILQLYKKKL